MRALADRRRTRIGLSRRRFGFGGYCLAWIVFSLIATLAQWGFERAALPDAHDWQALAVSFGGCLLIVAGLYQWSPLKDVLLAAIAGAMLFVQRHGGFRRDAKGSIALGARHGAYCIGCWGP